MLPPKGIVFCRGKTWMPACSARNLCAGMAAYPHRVADAAQGSAHVQLWTPLMAPLLPLAFATLAAAPAPP